MIVLVLRGRDPVLFWIWEGFVWWKLTLFFSLIIFCFFQWFSVLWHFPLSLCLTGEKVEIMKKKKNLGGIDHNPEMKLQNRKILVFEKGGCGNWEGGKMMMLFVIITPSEFLILSIGLLKSFNLCVTIFQWCLWLLLPTVSFCLLCLGFLRMKFQSVL